MNQAELQKMAEERLKDAKALIDGGRWEFAYYAAGYAVECALKSCILARMIDTGLVFQEKFKGDECRFVPLGSPKDANEPVPPNAALPLKIWPLTKFKLPPTIRSLRVPCEFGNWSPINSVCRWPRCE